MMVRNDLPVIYEDNDLIVVNKPQGLATGIGTTESICGRVFRARPELKEVSGYRVGEGGLLNRLDNETGGLVLFAKHDSAFRHFSAEMKSHHIRKIYSAICSGIPPENSGVIDIPIAHHPSKKKKMVRADRGQYRSRPRDAVTSWKVVERGRFHALLEVELYQGVRHQIRVHLASVGMPIVGDKLYNPADKNNTVCRLQYHALYCIEIQCRLFSGRHTVICIQSPLREVWDEIKRQENTNRMK
ncbi:MAG: RluA family pseudouridine synthase [Spirochaetales bacterium]|nr:RluA family pseudouridine synthase [Spirochaetales bacterium]